MTDLPEPEPQNFLVLHAAYIQPGATGPDIFVRKADWQAERDRALDAERERDAVIAHSHHLSINLREKVAALTADKEALVPLMQAVDAMAWTAGANVPPGIHFTTAKELGEFLSVLNAARRIVEGT